MIVDLLLDVETEIITTLSGSWFLVDAFQDVVDELAEQLLVLFREAEHPSNHIHRNVLGVLHSGVDDALAGCDLAHLVKQLLAQPLDLWLPRLNLLRSEGRQKESAGHVMERRIAGDRRRSTDRGRKRHIARPRNADHDGAAREVLGVVGDLSDGVVGDWHPHAAVTIGMCHGAAALAQLFPHLGCVRIIRRVRVVKVGARVSNRAVIVRVVRHSLPDVGAFRAAADDEVHRFAASIDGDDLVAGGLINPRGIFRGVGHVIRSR